MLKRITSVLLSLFILIGAAGCSTNMQDTESSQLEESPVTELSEFSEESAEPNTSDMVTHLTMKAYYEVKKADDTQRQQFESEALEWLKINADNIFDGNENMEKTMYYGDLLVALHSGMNDDIYGVGMYAEFAVRDVYQNIANVNDSFPQRYYKKFKNLLAKI